MGAKIFEMVVIYGKKKIKTPDLTPKKMKLNIANVNNLLGLDLSKKEISKYLKRMGYDYYGNDVIIPCYRADILHEVDIIEDIAIAYGFENFEEIIPNITTIPGQNSFNKFKEKISSLMTGFNLIEVNSNNITNLCGNSFHLCHSSEYSDRLLGTGCCGTNADRLWSVQRG